MKITPYQIDNYIKNIASNQDICGALIYGPEAGLVSIRSKQIARSIVPDAADPFLITNFFDKQIHEDNALLSDEFCSIPMFGGRKLIIINDAKNNVTASLKLIFNDQFKHVPNGNFILIIANELDAKSSLRKFSESNSYIASLACYEGNKSVNLSIIRDKFREYGLNCENGVADIIADKFGRNRQIIFNEIDKIALYAGDDKNVSCDIIREVIGDNGQISIDEFVNYVASRDAKNAYLILEKLFIEKVNSITLIRYLVNYFTKLYNVKVSVEKGGNLDYEIKDQRLFFKQEDFFRRHLNLWSSSKIAAMIYRLQKTEIACKSTGFNSETLFKSFINFAALK